MFSVAFGKFAAFYWSGQQVPASQWLVYLHILSHASLTRDQLYADQCSISFLVKYIVIQ